MREIKTIAIVGTGVIGASWAAFFLHKGFAVKAFDPAPGAKDNLLNRVEVFLKDLADTDVAAQQAMQKITFFEQLAQAVNSVDFIQENGPERLDIKKNLYAQITAHCPADTIIASSSSGLKISDIQESCIHPERVLLGHPFNPPHLLPLVEIVAGKKTAQRYIQSAFDFYKSLGKKPILIKKEVKGHVANRLQAAIWREAFSLVAEGVCSAEDVDLAITNGPGLRWAIFGPYLNMQLANQKGFKEAMHHLGGPMTEWWDDMKSYELSDSKIEHMEQEVEQFLAKLQGQNIQQLRDTALLEILSMRKKLDLP